MRRSRNGTIHRRSQSTVLRLPPKILRRVNRMIFSETGGMTTYAEICGWLKARGYRISHSALGRYSVQIRRSAFTMSPHMWHSGRNARFVQVLKEIIGLFENLEDREHQKERRCVGKKPSKQ